MDLCRDQQCICKHHIASPRPQSVTPKPFFFNAFIVQTNGLSIVNCPTTRQLLPQCDVQQCADVHVPPFCCRKEFAVDRQVDGLFRSLRTSHAHQIQWSSAYPSASRKRYHNMPATSSGVRMAPPGKGKCFTRASRSNRSAVPRMASAISFPYMPANATPWPE
jgi:hypothetical protein